MIGISFDPGGTTGWCIFEWTEDTPLTVLEHGMVPGSLEGFVTWVKVALNPKVSEKWPYGFDVVVSESFVLDGRTPNPDVTPLRIEGVLAYRFGNVVLQRNYYKVHANDKFLKAQGIWWKGPGHDRDALRHAYAYLKTNGHIPTIKAGIGIGKDD